MKLYDVVKMNIEDVNGDCLLFKRQSEKRWIRQTETNTFERIDNRDGVFFNVDDILADDYHIKADK